MDASGHADSASEIVIRQVTEADAAWIHALAAKAYPAGYYDPADADAWLRPMLKSPNHLMLRGERAMMVVQINELPFCRKFKTATFLPVASAGGGFRELVQMNAEAIAWARKRGAREFRWSAMTGVDLGPLARRFGARPSSSSYVLDLEPCATN